MGFHRGDGERRGISRGPVIALASVIVLVLAVVGWIQLRDRVFDQGVAAAQTCVEGEAQLDVAVDPEFADLVGTVAEKYNESGPVVRDHCILVSVNPAPSDGVSAALATPGEAEWTGPGNPPALWIPQSAMSTGPLAANPGVVDGAPKPIAYSPVLLAVPDALRDGMKRAGIGWQDLPRLQSDPESLPELGLPGWGSLKLLVPPFWDSATLTGQAVAAAVTGTAPLTAEAAASADARSALATLAAGSRIGELSGTPGESVRDLAMQSDHAAAPFHAVPVTATQLADYDSSSVSGYSPAGATPVADHPAVILAAPWVDETRSRAAAQFSEYLRAPEQADIFTAAGLTTTPPEGSLAPADATTAAAVLAPLTESFTPRSATVLLDVSASMSRSDGSGTLLSNVSDTMTTVLDTLPDDTEVGLWLYSNGLDGSRPYRVAVATAPLGQTRDGIGNTLESTTPATATSTYRSVLAAYESAKSGHSNGSTNSVLLITDGPNDDTSMSSAQFLAAVTSATDPDHHVQVDVIMIGENSDRATLHQLSAITGGTLIAVPNASGPEFDSAVTRMLG
ncbi:substrate-binding domain-containing protein [Rhodococcus gannanensis]|uniref:Substrate-binding domain-containing protein n=1 Tax=Rhodococcus gannanensis TaxID=1960308 RepID=A0ABW4P850_9NOCA